MFTQEGAAIKLIYGLCASNPPCIRIHIVVLKLSYIQKPVPDTQYTSSTHRSQLSFQRYDSSTIKIQVKGLAMLTPKTQCLTPSSQDEFHLDHKSQSFWSLCALVTFPLLIPLTIFFLRQEAFTSSLVLKWLWLCVVPYWSPLIRCHPQCVPASFQQ